MRGKKGAACQREMLLKSTMDYLQNHQIRRRENTDHLPCWVCLVILCRVQL